MCYAGRVQLPTRPCSQHCCFRCVVSSHQRVKRYSATMPAVKSVRYQSPVPMLTQASLDALRLGRAGMAATHTPLRRLRVMHG